MFFFTQPQKDSLWIFYDVEFYFKHAIYSLAKPSIIINKAPGLKIKQFSITNDEKLLVILYENSRVQNENILEFMTFEEKIKNFTNLKSIKGSFSFMEMSKSGDKLLTAEKDHSITLWNVGII